MCRRLQLGWRLFFCFFFGFGFFFFDCFLPACPRASRSPRSRAYAVDGEASTELPGQVPEGVPDGVTLSADQHARLARQFEDEQVANAQAIAAERASGSETAVDDEGNDEHPAWLRELLDNASSSLPPVGDPLEGLSPDLHPAFVEAESADETVADNG